MKTFKLKTINDKKGAFSKVFAFVACLTGVGMVVGAEQSDAQIMRDVSARPEYQSMIETIEQDMKDYQDIAPVLSEVLVMQGLFKNQSMKYRMAEVFPYQAGKMTANASTKAFGAGVASTGAILIGASMLSNLKKRKNKTIESEMVQQA